MNWWIAGLWLLTTIIHWDVITGAAREVFYEVLYELGLQKENYK